MPHSAQLPRRISSEPELHITIPRNNNNNNDDDDNEDIVTQLRSCFFERTNPTDVFPHSVLRVIEVGMRKRRRGGRKIRVQPRFASREKRKTFFVTPFETSIKARKEEGREERRETDRVIEEGVA